MIPQRLQTKYNDALPYLEQLKKRVAETLAAFADERNFPFVGRVKTAESIAEKIEMGRYRSFSQLDDLVAFTLVIPRADSEREIVDFCGKRFDLVEVREKRTTAKSPDIFRFDATRIVARAKRPPDLGDYSGPSIFDFQFEIQVRTAFEHAWSVATHDLVYKGTSVDWRRMRLAAQLKASSEGLDAAIAAFDHIANSMSQSPWRSVNHQIEVSTFVEGLFASGKLPAIMRPASISRFVGNFCTLVSAITPKRAIPDYIPIIDDELRNSSSEELPKSISLYQLFLGVLCRRGLVESIRGIPCHITSELSTIFPETQFITSKFDYDS